MLRSLRDWARKHYTDDTSTPADRLLFRRTTSLFTVVIVASTVQALVVAVRNAETSRAQYIIISGMTATWLLLARRPSRLRLSIQIGTTVCTVAVVYGVLMTIPLGNPSMIDLTYLTSIPLVAAHLAGLRSAKIWTWIIVAIFLATMPMFLVFGVTPASPAGGFVNTTISLITLIAITSAFALIARRQNDIQQSELRVAHAELADVNADLERTVERRTAELAHALDDAQAASRAKGAFVANMSHELRTPLNGVLGVAELLTDTDPTPEQTALLESLESSGRALLDTLSSILDFATIESGGIELTDHPFDPAEVVHRAAVTFAPAAAAHGVDLAVVCAPDLPSTITGDALQLGRAIERLVSNAVKFCVAGSIGVYAWCEHDAATGLQSLCVQVADTGPGITADQLDHLWDAFAPGDDSSSKSHSGVGLGLTLVHQYAVLSRGRVDVASTVGSGTVFTLRIPAEGEASEPLRLPVTPGRIGVVAGPLTRWTTAFTLVCAGADAVAADPDDLTGFDLVIVDRGHAAGAGAAVPPTVRKIELGTATGPTLPCRPESLLFAVVSAPPAVDMADADAGAASATSTWAQAADADATVGVAEHAPAPQILIVEDNPVNRKVLTKMVATLGYETLCAENGRDGADRYAAEADRIAAVLMDCQMPILDGFGATREIRTHETTTGRNRCPIIAVTANALEGDREKCLAAGMDDFLAKPVDRARLGAALDEWAPISVAARAL